MLKQSFLSKIAEIILRQTKPKYMNSKKEIESYLDNKRDEEFNTIFKTETFNSMKFVSFGEKYNDNQVILYIHGGAYVNQMNYQHTLYCYILSKFLKKRIIAPVYPLAPNHHYDECYKQMIPFYNHLRSKFHKITMIGDSAGGGFILSFCQYLNKINVKQPENIIVFSPWLDVSMKNRYDDTNDPILGNIGLKEIGKHWAKNLETSNYLVSPFYGDNHNLPRILITAGTNEIFYPKIKEYTDKLLNDGVDAKLIVGENLFHIYPLFPIPEAYAILKEIKKEIES